jgi:isopenicillin-N epimerase
MAHCRPVWRLDPGITFLNHGSFGACPEPVLRVQAELRAEMEREPVRFLSRERLESRLDAARAALGAFVGADPEDLVFVPNATTGVNTVVRSLRFADGDELLTTNHLYNACRNALEFVAGESGARVVVAAVPFPLAGDDPVMQAVLGAVTPRTRLAVLDHVTSPTALVLPLADLVRELAARGVDTLVDGAHAPGMVPLDLRAVGAAYYVGNGHKWALRAQGRRVPPRPARPPGTDPAARHQPRRELSADRPVPVPPRVRLDGHARPDAVPGGPDGAGGDAGAAARGLARPHGAQSDAGAPGAPRAVCRAPRDAAVSRRDDRGPGGRLPARRRRAPAAGP